MTTTTAPPSPPVISVDASATTRRTIVSWVLWDLGSNAFNTVMWSFVFSVYVTSAAVAGSKDTGQSVWALMQTVSGLLLAVLAPMVGAWADRVRHRRHMLAGSTLVVAACMAACWFVRPGRALFYVVLGTGLLALANLVQEIAGIFYNAMLLQISTPATIGRISGAGWGAGYLGGVLCLIAVLVGLIQGGPDGTGLLGVPAHDGLNLRAVALFCAAFLTLASVPVMLWGPDPDVVRTDPRRFRVGRAYREIGTRILHMWRDERTLLHFLLASAVYRDGLAAVFAFAGTIAAGEYGFSASEVALFGLAANVVAAFGTWGMGVLDDLLGPRWVIIGALITMIVAGLVVVVAHDKMVFWVGGIAISSMVGAVQSSSRSLLTRTIPVGEENETFGLYATAGRAASFLAPTLVSVFTVLAGARYGLLGIIVTLAIGLAMFLPVQMERHVVVD